MSNYKHRKIYVLRRSWMLLSRVGSSYFMNTTPLPLKPTLVFLINYWRAGGWYSSSRLPGRKTHENRGKDQVLHSSSCSSFHWAAGQGWRIVRAASGYHLPLFLHRKWYVHIISTGTLQASHCYWKSFFTWSRQIPAPYLEVNHFTIIP